jgi:hypothetical protein
MNAELPIRGEQVQAELFQIVPELEIRFRKEFEDLYDFATENPGKYLLFEDIVFPFLKEIAGDVSKEQILERLFDFFERMASSTDPPVLDLLGIAITEQLAYYTELFDEVERFIGAKTKQMIERDLKFFQTSVAERM